ncbi:MAG: diaminopimelate decarboxylase [Chloroflexi bacterium]|nr:diaminopimelate decarboxylase [Chloroflexota bacterium]
MIENTSIAYRAHHLYMDDVPIPELLAHNETPFYVYSLPRVLHNYRRIQQTFALLKPHIHYSAKANANLAVLRALIAAGAGIDAVSMGEIQRALYAGAQPQHVVFAGVGKTLAEIRYALEQGVGWFNVENLLECRLIDAQAQQYGQRARIALRLNPDIQADTHPHIATGHGKAKFGLPAAQIAAILAQQSDYPFLDFAGIHVHIGSQLRSPHATRAAIERALELIAPYPNIRTVNIGGGLPVAYAPNEYVPSWADFADTLTPLLAGYEVLLEPGRAVVADAGLLLTTVLYRKEYAEPAFVICDASMSELLRPALYNAHHEIVPVVRTETAPQPVTLVGPVCESTDVLGTLTYSAQPGDTLAILTAGAYGLVMSSNYNQRPRPAEIVVGADGRTWRVVRRREALDDLLRFES